MSAAKPETVSLADGAGDTATEWKNGDPGRRFSFA
jgi:hypothetical protein